MTFRRASLPSLLSRPERKSQDMPGESESHRRGAAFIPCPLERGWVQPEESFFCKARQELASEEWIACRLAMHELGQRTRPLVVDAQVITDKDLVVPTMAASVS